MKRFLMTAMATLFTSFFCSSTFAAGFPLCSDICLVPYVGAAAAMRHSQFQKNFGENVFKKYYPEGDILFGVKLSDYVGVEAGYKVSVTKTRVASLGAGENAVGTPVQFPPELYRSTISFKVWHADLIGFFPIYGQDCISLLGSIGISRGKLFARNKLVQDYAGGVSRAYADNLYVNTFVKRKAFLTAGAGVQFAIDEKTSLRAKVGWENTARFRSMIAQESPNAILKPKNSFIYSIGATFNFR